MAKLILIAGVSRSGKTTLAHKLASDLSRTVILHQDEYVHNESLLPRIKNRIDWEKPETINWDRLLKTYHQSSEKYDFVIIEGIFALNNEELVKIADKTILLKLDHEEFLESRKKENRWGNEPSWFIDHVWNSHLIFHNPHKLIPSHTLYGPSPTDYEEILNQLKS